MFSENKSSKPKLNEQPKNNLYFLNNLIYSQNLWFMKRVKRAPVSFKLKETWHIHHRVSQKVSNFKTWVRQSIKFCDWQTTPISHQKFSTFFFPFAFWLKFSVYLSLNLFNLFLKAKLREKTSRNESRNLEKGYKRLLLRSPLTELYRKSLSFVYFPKRNADRLFAITNRCLRIPAFTS